MSPLEVAAVLAAGAAGAVLRYAAGRLLPASPWPVLVVNVAASLIAGLGMHSPAALVVVTGFAGGLSTFSTFSVETVQLFAQGRWRAATASVALNLVLGIAAATAGWAAGFLLFAR